MLFLLIRDKNYVTKELIETHYFGALHLNYISVALISKADMVIMKSFKVRI
jgi:hypothetical protein